MRRRLQRPHRHAAPSGPGERRATADRGSVAVEAALVTPLFVLLVFGIIEFGFVYKDWLAVSSSVRAGARLASAEPRMASFAQDTANSVATAATALNMKDVTALWVYKADTNGNPMSGGFTGGCSVSCVTFKWDAGTSKFAPVTNTWLSTSQNACAGDPGRDSVGVYLSVKHDAFTGLIFKSLNLSEHTVMTLEPIPSSAVCKP